MPIIREAGTAKVQIRAGDSSGMTFIGPPNFVPETDKILLTVRDPHIHRAVYREGRPDHQPEDRDFVFVAMSKFPSPPDGTVGIAVFELRPIPLPTMEVEVDWIIVAP